MQVITVVDDIDDEDEYIAFGLSGLPDRTMMIGSDVTAIYTNVSDNQITAVDYALLGRNQVRSDTFSRFLFINLYRENYRLQ